MRARRLGAALLALALLGVAAGAVLRCDARPTKPRYAARDPDRRVVRALRLSAQAAGTETPAPAWLFEPGVPGRRIAGVVVAGGQPVAGARVTLQGESYALPGTPAPNVTTDAAGRFDFGVRPAGVYVVAAAAEGFRPDLARANLKDPDAEPPPDELVLELSPCERWSAGTVRDAYGGAVVDGVVSVVARPGPMTGFVPLLEVPIEVDGSFALCPPDVSPLSIWVRAPGYGTVSLSGRMPEGGWDVVLLPEGVIKGVVLDPAGEPLAGARVVVTGDAAFSAPWVQTALSGEDGRFRLEGLAPGRYSVGADHGHHGSNWPRPTVTVSPGEITTGVVVHMSACRKVAGVVVANGEPVVGARLVPQDVYTQADGSFVIGCTTFEAFHLKVEGFDVDAPTVAAGERDVDDLVVSVRPRASVSGVVVADGEPVAGAIVTASEARGAFSLQGTILGEARPRAKSDGQGRFRLTGLSAGEHEIVARHASSRRRSRPEAVVVGAADVSGVELELAIASQPDAGPPIGTLSIAGRVRYGDGAPAAFAAVRTARRESHALTDEQGRFVLEHLAEGRYDLSAAATDGSAGKRPAVAAGETGVEIVLGRVGSLRVDIEGGRGRCTVRAATNRLFMGAAAAGTNTVSLDGLSPGDYVVRVRCEEAVGEAQVSISPGQSASLEVRVRPGATVRGRVVASDSGEPLADLVCGAGGAHTYSEADGSFELTEVMPGAVSVDCGSRFGSVQRWSGHAPVELESGQVATVEIAAELLDD